MRVYANYIPHGFGWQVGVHFMRLTGEHARQHHSIKVYVGPWSWAIGIERG